MTNTEITMLYRQLGRELRKLGAERIFLLSSKYIDETKGRLLLELAVTGAVDEEVWEKKRKSCFSEIDMKMIFLDDEIDEQLDAEVLEDSIQL